MHNPRGIRTLKEGAMMPNNLFKFVILRQSAGIPPNRDRTGYPFQPLHDVCARYARILQERLKVSTSGLLRPILLALLTTLIAPQLGFAQQAPTGAHYGGRATDTGFGGSLVNLTGSYSTSIPLDLPTERAGLPVPLQISYGVRGVGAAGLGWDIPFSYIRRDRTFAHRRPAYGGFSLPQPRERTFLSLLGTGGELIRSGDAWVIRSGTLELTVRESGSAYFAYDGAGRTYTFLRPAQFGSAGLWLLDSVSSSGGASVRLSYQISSRLIAGGNGLEVNLARIAYNTSVFT